MCILKALIPVCRKRCQSYNSATTWWTISTLSIITLLSRWSLVLMLLIIALSAITILMMPSEIFRAWIKKNHCGAISGIWVPLTISSLNSNWITTCHLASSHSLSLWGLTILIQVISTISAVRKRSYSWLIRILTPCKMATPTTWQLTLLLNNSIAI